MNQNFFEENMLGTTKTKLGLLQLIAIAVLVKSALLLLTLKHISRFKARITAVNF